MSGIEFIRAVKWMRAKGLSDDEILDCMLFVADGADNGQEEEEE